MSESDKQKQGGQNQQPAPAEKPVDEKAQEDAAKEREKTGGYQ
ncbi:hypothetical protein [Roseomonas marmotae]|nr:hypothetical protein [Roseomonas marmotae]